jgi:cell filamentation protein
MDDSAIGRLNNVLKTAKPEKLRGLMTHEFSAYLGRIYVELDYIHPFSDGNSRTLRTFTRQLARESGYELSWDRFSSSDIGRDLLYIARDRSVNKLAMPHVQNESTMRKISFTQDRLKANRALPDLLLDAIRPSRAVAFEQMAESKALKAHPELDEAYKTMHKAATYFELKMPDIADARAAGIQSVLKHVQSRLNIGETGNFSQGRAPSVQERQTSQRPPDPEPERER